MAYTTQPTQTGGIVAALQSVFNRIGKAIVLVAESNSRMRRVKALQAMSDAELAKRGIKREEIVQTVFADAYDL